MSTRRGVLSLSRTTDRALRLFLSFALVFSYIQFRQLMQPASLSAAPAPVLAVSVSASDRPLLGGQATFTVTVTNSGPGKAFNIGVSDLFGSTLANPNGRVTLVSASDGSGALAPNSVISSPTTTGDLKTDFVNIRDLEAGETYTMTVLVDTSGDLSWQVGDSITSTVTATGFGAPDGTDPSTPVTAATSAKLIPIKITSKTVNQSTGVEQASGTEARTFSYAINVQNNYRGNTTSTVVIDRLPDGIEYLGPTGATPAPAVSRDASSGVTTLSWNLGTLGAAAAQTLTYSAGIRYDYWGTSQAGTNRLTSDFTSASAIPTASIVPDKVTLTNNVSLSGSYAGQVATDAASARVTNAYLTVAKSNDRGSGGNETTVTYTLAASASQYYDIVDTSTIVLHDRLPDGQTYVAGSASSVPDTITANPDGTTDLYWVLSPIPHSSARTVTFKAVIDYLWQGASHPAGLSVIAGDSMTNVSDVTGTYDDLIKDTRPNAPSTSSASAGFSTSIPSIYKEVKNPVTGVWQSTVASATPGDVLEFRVRFNTTDGLTPEKTNIIMGKTDVTDWLPPATRYNNDAVVTYSDATDFSDPDTSTAPAINISTPTTPTIGGLQGIEWYLGNVQRAGWWQATFSVTVNNVTAVAAGTTVNNYWKLTGRNTSDTPYSARAVVPIAYSEPVVGIAKSLAATPTVGTVVGGQEITYTVTLTNTGSAAARDVVVTDTVPVGMRTTPPTVLGVYSSSLAATLAPSPATGNSWRSSWDSTSGVLTVDLQDTPASVDTSIPPASFVRITYKTRIDNGIPAATSFTNSARATYASRPSGPDSRLYSTGPVSSTVQVASLNVVKSGPQTVTFGQTATYTATVTVPANTIAPWTKLIDTINMDGFAYVPGSSSLADISGTPVSGAAFDGTSTPIVNRTTNGNTTLAWQLRNTIDNSGTVTPYVFRLTFSVLADGVEDNGTWENAPTNTSPYNRNYTASDNVRAWWAATAVASRPSTGTVAVTGLVSPTVGGTVPNSNTVVTTVVQPLLRTVKSVIGAGPFFGTSTVDYQTVISNVGSSTAYDLTWRDVLPSRIDSATLLSVQLNGTTLSEGVDYTSSFAALPTATIAFGSAISLTTTQTITIRYRGRIIPAVASGAAITNTADMNWSSLPGSVTAERLYSDTASESAYTLDTSSVTVNAPSPTIAKTQPSGLATATIGQTFSYKVLVGIPSNTTVYSGQVTDTVSPAFEVVSVETSPAALGAAAVGARTSTGTVIVWALPATVTNPPYDTLEMTVTVRVANTYPGGAPVDGLPVGVDGTAQDTLQNRATLRWLDAAVGSLITRSSALTPAVSVVAPFIRTTKTSAVTTAQAGQTVGYTISIENSGTSTAYDVSWRDVVPARLGAATLTGIQLVNGATTALASPADFSADFSGLPTVTVDFARPLPPGAKFLITYSSPVDAAVQSGQTLVNLETVLGASSFPGVSTVGERVLAPVSATTTVTLKSPALVVSKAISDAYVQAGQVVTFTVSVSNVGNASAYSVNVTDTLPAGVTYVAGSTGAAWNGSGSSTADPAGAPGPNLSWPLAATLPAGGTLTLTYRASIDGAAPSASATNTASAFGVDGAGAPVPADASGWIPGDTDNDDTASRPFSITHPGISQIKLKVVGQDPFIQVGQAGSFSIRVTNTGDTALATVPLIDVFDSAALTFVPASIAPNSVVPAGTLTWNDITGAGTLAAGATTTITVNFTGASIPVGAITTNTATASGTDVNGDPAGTVASADSITLTRPHVTITKVLDPSQDTAVQVGESVRFQIGVRNTGTTTLATIPLTDAFDAASLGYVGSAPAGVAGPGSITWATVGPLAPGAATTVTVDFIVTARPASGSTVNTASASGATDENTDTAPTSTSTRPIRITAPAVAMVKSLASGQDPVVRVGDAIAFDLVVTNSGDTTLTTVPLTDAFDSATLSFVSATVAPGSTAPAGTLTWANLGTLAPGATTTVTVTFTALAVPAGQVSTDTATVYGARDLNNDAAPNSSDDAAVRVTAPAVRIVKTRSSADGAIQVGDIVTFDLAISNTGDTTLSTVVLSDAFDPAVLGFANATIAPDSVTPAGTLTWTNLGTLAPSATATVAVTFTALSNPAGQVTTDTAGVSATDVYGDSPVPDTDAATVKVTAPALSFTKTRVSLDPAIQTSQTVTFDLTVNNTGDTTLTTVPLSDTWDPAHLAFFSASALPDVLAAGSAKWTLGPIAPGGSQTVTVTFIAIANVPGLTTTDNASVTGALDENGDPAADASGTANVDVTRPAVSVLKALHAGQDANVQVGDTVAFDIAVTNSGDTTLALVPLADAYDAAVFAPVSATPASVDYANDGVLDWTNVGPLAQGQTTTVTVTFTAVARSAGIDSVDAAAVSGATDVNGDVAAQVSDVAVARVTAPSIAILKSLAPTQDPQVQAGQWVEYYITVTNTGDTTLTAIPLTDTWDPAVFVPVAATGVHTFTASSCTWLDIAPLAPGDSALRRLSLSAIAAPAGLVSTDTATVSGTDEFSDAAAVTSSSASVLVTRPEVAVNKMLHAGQDGEIQVGGDVTFDLTVTNTGDTTLTTVPLSDTYDSAALAPASATPASADYVNDGTLDWADVGPLAQGETTTITVTFTALAVPAGQVSTDTATVSGAEDLYNDAAPNATDTATIRITHPNLSIAKSLHAGQDTAVQAGGIVVFDVTVTNTGDTTLTTVPLDDTYDAASLSYASASPAENSASAGSLHWDNVGPLAPGASATIQTNFTAISNPPGQITTNTASTSGAIDQYGDLPPGATATAVIKITAPSLVLSKNLAAGQDPYIQSGQTADFDLTVTNSGDTTLSTVPLSDTWDSANLLYSSSDLPPSLLTANSASWLLTDLGPSQSVTVRLTLLAVGAFTPHALVDTATVVGARDENSDLTDDSVSTAEVNLTRGAVTVTKALTAGQDPFVQVGQTVAYDITVTNSGDIDLASVPLAEAYDAAIFSLTAATVSPDTTSSGSALWNNVGPLVVGQTATVTVTMTAIGTSDAVASVDTATVSGARDINDDPAAGDTATAAATVTHPAIDVRKALAPGQSRNVARGAQITYDLVVSNTGDTTLTAVPLSDTFDPSQLEVVSTSLQPTSTPVAGSVSWPNVAGSQGIAPGASVTVHVTFRTLAIGPDITDTARVTGATDGNGDSAATADDTDSTLGVYEPSLFVISKTADPDNGTIVLPGSTITYTISWNNTQNVTVPGVVITDPLPASVSYTSGTLRLGGAAQTDSADADAGSFAATSNTVTFNLGEVSALSSGTATFDVKVGPESASRAGVMNTALFRSSDATLGAAGPVYHPVDPFDITKTARDLNGGKLKGGDIVEWTITVTNTGLTPTTRVVVTDTVPRTTIYVDGSIRGRGADDSGAPGLVWRIGTMQVDETQVLTLRTRVKKGLPAGTRILNQATVRSDQSRPKRSDNPATPTGGDATILVAQTSGSEDWRQPLAAGLLLMACGAWLADRRRKTTLAHAATAAARRAARDARDRNA